MYKRQIHAWQLWLSRCDLKRKHLWKIKLNTWPLKNKQIFADYIYIKYMGGYLPFNLWRILFFWGYCFLISAKILFTRSK